MMKIKHLVACISLCTLLNFSNGYTANNTQLTLDDLNGAEISIFDNYNFENQNVHIYTKPTENIAKIKVHKYFGDPSSEEVEVTNNNGFFEIEDKYLHKYKKAYDNATYGIAEYHGNYYAVLLSDNDKVDDTVWSKSVFVVNNQNNTEYLDLLQRIPIHNTYKINNNNLEDKLLGKGEKIFLVRSWLGGMDWKDGPMTFYANPPEKLNTIKAHTLFLCDNRPEINVRNNNGKFDISKDDLKKNDPLLYNESYKDNLNYGILKYNNQYYLVNYEIANINNSTEKCKIFPLCNICDAFEIQYLDEEQYNSYYHQIRNVNNNKEYEYQNENNNMNDDDDNESYYDNDKEKYSDNKELSVDDNINDINKIDENNNLSDNDNINEINTSPDNNKLSNNENNYINYQQEEENKNSINAKNSIDVNINGDNEVQSNNSLINNNINNRGDLAKQIDEVFTTLTNNIYQTNSHNNAADNFIATGVKELYENEKHKAIKNILITKIQLSEKEIEDCIKYIRQNFYYFNVSSNAIKYLSEYFQLRNQLDNLK